MNPIRWEPFTALDEMMGRLPGLFGRQHQLPGPGDSTAGWSPAVDISETGREFVLRTALPAVRKEDVKLTVEDGMLTISGERQYPDEQKGEKFHRVESYYGAFSRSFALPESIDTASIRAESGGGMLTVHLPKAKSETHRLTTIKVQ